MSESIINPADIKELKIGESGVRVSLFSGEMLAVYGHVVKSVPGKGLKIY